MEKIYLYTQPTCPQCKMVHMLLDKKGIEYIECQDVEIMQQKGINHTPALMVGDKIIQGKEIFDWVKGARNG